MKSCPTAYKFMIAYLMATGRLLPSTEKNVSMCICILVHVCLLRREMTVCKAIHLSFRATLSPGEAASGMGIIAAVVCTGRCNI